LNPYQFYPNGGGGYFASAEDLIRYGLFHAKHLSPKQKVLSPANIDRMHRFEKSASKIFQLGWHNVGHALVSNGSITGANSHLAIVPSEDLVVVCLTNSSNQYADQLADKIINVMAPDLKPQMTYEKYMEEYETPYQATPKLAGKWSGTIYAHHINLPIQLDFKPDGQITVQIGKETAKVLENVTFNRYNKLEAYFNGKVPVPEYDGKEEVFHNLHLVLINNELVGHISVRFSRENNAFQYGVYSELKHE
ncbi:MAG: hypothetical protein SFU99_18685, partial [Saprospiraceae bacterium]|nr:hypothetical protein [Saprospiraceae bacterium]